MASACFCIDELEQSGTYNHTVIMIATLPLADRTMDMRSQDGSCPDSAGIDRLNGAYVQRHTSRRSSIHGERRMVHT